MLTSNGPEKMSPMDQEQLEEVPQDVSVGVRVIAAMSRYGPYQDKWGNERQFSGGNKLSSKHSCCAAILC